MNFRGLRVDEVMSGALPAMNLFGSWFIYYSSSINNFDMDDKEG